MGFTFFVVFGCIGIIVLFFCLCALIFQYYCVYKIFKKAQTPGWHALIPVLSSYQYGKLALNRPLGGIAYVISHAASIFISCVMLYVSGDGHLEYIPFALALLIARGIHMYINYKMLQAFDESPWLCFIMLINTIGDLIVFAIIAFNKKDYIYNKEDLHVAPAYEYSANKPITQKEDYKMIDPYKRYCNRCGSEIKSGQKFCEECGRQL